MQSKDNYLLKKLAEKGKLDYSEDDFKALKKNFIDNLLIVKDKEKAFEDAYKIVFGGKEHDLQRT